MTQRYFSASPITTSTISLEGPEAHHLLHVMRATAGTEIVLFDGSGKEFKATVHHLGRTDVELKILSTSEVDREANFDLNMGIALPKGDRQRWLVQKLVELGVAELVPLATNRSIAQPTKSALERLRRTVIEASKQSGRNRLMCIRDPLSLDEYLRQKCDSVLRWLAHPDGEVLPREVGQELSRGVSIKLAIGPEGGSTDDEVALARSHDWRVVNLGSRVLRIETAAVALAAWLSLTSEENNMTPNSWSP